MPNSYKINSPYNNLIKLNVTPGHYATSSSHINYFIDLTTLKARTSEAKAVAKSMSTDYIASTIVDTIICMDGTDVIGAYLAGISIGILEVMYEATHPVILQIVVHAERSRFGRMQSPHQTGLEATAFGIVEQPHL